MNDSVISTREDNASKNASGEYLLVTGLQHDAPEEPETAESVIVQHDQPSVSFTEDTDIMRDAALDNAPMNVSSDSLLSSGHKESEEPKTVEVAIVQHKQPSVSVRYGQ